MCSQGCRGLDDYTYACSTCSLDEQWQELEHQSAFRQAQMLDEESCGELSIEKLENELQALQPQLELLERDVEIPEESEAALFRSRICLFLGFNQQEWHESSDSNKESLGSNKMSSCIKFHNNRALCDLQDLGARSVQQHQLESHAMLINLSEYLHELDIRFSQEWLEDFGRDMVWLDMTAAKAWLLRFVLFVQCQHIGCFDETPIIKAMLSYYLDSGLSKLQMCVCRLCWMPSSHMRTNQVPGLDSKTPTGRARAAQYVDSRFIP